MVQNKGAGKNQGNAGRQDWRPGTIQDEDSAANFSENTAPYSVGGNQGEMSATQMGKKQTKTYRQK